MAEKIEILAAYWNELLNNQTIKRKHPHTPRGAIERKNDEKKDKMMKKEKQMMKKEEEMAKKAKKNRRKTKR